MPVCLSIMQVRFDDTNPSKEKDEFVQNIIKDMADLGLKYEKLTYTSDYFPQMLDLGDRLIKAGLMYADDTPVDQMREVRHCQPASTTSTFLAKHAFPCPT
jgi:glutamyl-tRNA synthetase